MKKRHLSDLYVDLAQEDAGRPLFHYKEDGQYVPVSCGQFSDDCQSFALALQDEGVNQGDRVAIIANNCLEWVISDMGILTLGAVVVPVYPTLTASEMQVILLNAGVSWIVVEDDVQYQKINEIQSQLPQLQGVILISGKGQSDGVRFFSLKEFLLKGAQIDASIREQLMNQRKSLSSETLASIIYTSGTTGVPKGVCLTHANFLSNLEGVSGVISVSEKDSALSFLPLSHVFERMAGYYFMLYSGAQVYFAESIDTVGADLLQVSPTVMIAVPRIFEKVQSRIYQQLSGVKQILFQWAIKVGRQCCERSHLGVWLRFQKWLATRLVFSKIRAKLGGRLRFAVSGGAPLGKSLGTFYQSVGILILEGYGLTETSPVITCNQESNFRMGSVGKVLPNLEIRLEEDGELCVKGPSVMQGYYQLPEKTSEVLKDGWFYTGDIAEIDEDGFVSIVDRKKDLIVLSNGKNIAPQPLERQLMTSRFISQSILVGESRNFLTALIVPDWGAFLNSPENRKWGDDPELLCQHDEVKAFFSDIIDKKMASFARFEKVKKFQLLVEEFTLDRGYLTPSLKPKRAVIRRDYKAHIDEMYQTG